MNPKFKKYTGKYIEQYDILYILTLLNEKLFK